MPSVTYRTATLGDAELAADLMTAAYPALPQDPVILRLRWERPRTGFAYGRFIADRAGGPIRYLGWIHGPLEEDPDRLYDDGDGRRPKNWHYQRFIWRLS